MKIKLTKPIGGNKTGDTINTTPKTADFLTTNGYAEHVETAEPAPKPRRTKKGGGASPSASAKTAG